MAGEVKGVGSLAGKRILGYPLRSAFEILHKEVKTYFGFRDVAARSFISVKVHVHGVYWAHVHP